MSCLRKGILGLVLVAAGLVAGPLEEGYQAMNDKDWDMAVVRLTEAWHAEPDQAEPLYYLALSYYQQGDLPRASRRLTAYLTLPDARLVTEAMELKYAIAEGYRQGAKKRLMGIKRAPKLFAATDDALALYDEIVTAMPYTELAGRALYSKGLLYAQVREPEMAISSLEKLIDVYPTHRLASDAHLMLLHLCVEQSELDNETGELLRKARSVWRQWTQAFPNDPRHAEGKKLLVGLEEKAASELLERARFYEKKHKKPAACLYYQQLLAQFPDSQSADRGKTRLALLQPTEPAKEIASATVAE